jgi:hypothetical protein
VVEEGDLDPQVGSHPAGLGDERLDGRLRSGVAAAVGKRDEGWGGHGPASLLFDLAVTTLSVRWVVCRGGWVVPTG